MSLITLPTFLARPTAVEWILKSNTQSFVSPLTGATQTLSLPGDKWAFTFIYDYVSREDADTLSVFVAQLRGMGNRFKTGNPARSIILGAGGGTPLVKGASQTGASLLTDGWPNSTTVLKAGDYFEVNSEYKIVAADVTSDGSGNATITFEPPLRSSPADNAPITVTGAGATFMLANKDQSLKFNNYYSRSFTLEGIETFS